MSFLARRVVIGFVCLWGWSAGLSTAQPNAAQPGAAQLGAAQPTVALHPPATYPRVTVYQGILHPLATFSDHAPALNFRDYYVVGFPVGVNLWKTAKIGYSLEVVPFVRAEGGVSRASNVLFHPGLLLGLGKGLTLASRIAFETSGRYGFTPVLNKTFHRPGRDRPGPVSYFLAMPLPFRFGNDRAASFTVGLQFGITL